MKIHLKENESSHRCLCGAKTYGSRPSTGPQYTLDDLKVWGADSFHGFGCKKCAAALVAKEPTQ